MKKHFMYLTAVMFGILFAFASCKDKHKHYDDDEDEEDEESVEKDDKDDKDGGSTSRSKETIKLADLIKEQDLSKLADADFSDIDTTGVNLDDLNKLDLEHVDANTAELLLKVAAAQVSDQLPQDAGDGIVIMMFDVLDNEVRLTMQVDEAQLGGVGMKAFGVLLNDKNMKEKLMKQMVSGMDADGKLAMKMIAIANKDFVMKFIGKDSKEEADCRLSTSELSRLVK